MIDFHDFRHKKKENNSISHFVKKLKKKSDLIYLDEFQVTNIVDAMILGKLFEEIFLENIKIQTNVIEAALSEGVRRLLFLGSSCIYPKYSPQPIKEDYLLSDTLEPTNQWYAIAKISGIKSCEAIKKQFKKDYISLMPTNLYGYNDNFDLKTSHVIPAMIRKFHEAKAQNKPAVELWGDGSPMREFLYADDLANALVYLMLNYNEKQFVNVGYGSDVTIKELAKKVSEVIGFKGGINWDSTKPNGTPRKLMDSSKLFNTGWKPKVNLEEGIRMAYEEFLKLENQV